MTKRCVLIKLKYKNKFAYMSSCGEMYNEKQATQLEVCPHCKKRIKIDNDWAVELQKNIYDPIGR